MSDKTIAQEALEVLSAIPKENWTTDAYCSNDGLKFCALGHWAIHKNNGKIPNLFGYLSEDLREATSEYLFKMNLITVEGSIAAVNDLKNINGWNEPEIKDRVIHFLQDMVNAGY